MEASKGGGHGHGSDSISYVMVNDQNGNGSPNYGDTIKAVLSTATPTPWVRLLVFQNGRIVEEAWGNYTNDPVEIALNSPTWDQAADKAADGTLELYATIPPGKNNKPLASVSFPIAA